MTETTEHVVQPEETPAAGTQPAEATEAKTVDRDEQGKFRNPVQPRIDELTRKGREAEREAAYWRQRSQQLEAQTSAKAAPKEPKAEDFTDQNEYVRALSRYEAKQYAAEALKLEREERNKQDAQKDRQRSWADRASKSRQSFTDFDTVLSGSDVGVTDAVRDSMADSDLETDIAYHLAKNPTDAERLNALSGKALDREMGRLEDRLRGASKSEAPEAEPVVEVREAPRKTSSAPAPARPISSGRTSAPDMEKMSMEDFTKLRKSQGAKWAR